ncbi:uncharacterized protein N7515_004242 [Penicillium bovifimosum]|uniref:Rhodopsin domain-containing protein n=1 Tax=Penicillium bovifimosum TaxID=126998 RepID=A0A9W9L6J4_9EURO|nr:uncharacterized protein N7515_004242 [Penicillium bovifimosum]KAJ5139394.1 hypothetical protein N7515_004242 [Penicillium bovifimosum]
MPPNTLGPALEKGIWVAVVIAAVIVVLRVFAKFQIKRVGIDDGLMILAELLAIASTVFLSLSVKHGFGTDLYSMPRKDLQDVLKYIAIQVPLVTLSTTFARSAFILYLLPLLGTNKYHQAALWTVLIIQFGANVASAVLPLSICRDVAALWDAEVAATTSCGDSDAVFRFAYFSNTFNSATDLFLAVFPAVVFWNLNLRLRIKIGLIILLSLGVFAMVASIIKTTKLNSVPSITNMGAAGGIELIRWGYIENVIIIITSSIPCIRPLVISSVRKISSGKFTHTDEPSTPAGGSPSVGPKEAKESPHARGFDPDVEDSSVDRILDDTRSVHTSTSVEGAESPSFESPDFKKDAGISVITGAGQSVTEPRSNL